MVDPETIERRLRIIDERVRSLDAIRSGGRDAFIVGPELQAAAERHLQIAIQAALDIAIHIVAEDSARTPEDYASAFRALAGIGVLEDALADRLADAAKLRNVLVHLYAEVDPARVWDHIARLADLEELVAAIEAYLSR